LGCIDEVKNGQKKVTLIVEDPFGHSIIMDDNAQKHELTNQEIQKLKTGFLTFENEELDINGNNNPEE